MARETLLSLMPQRRARVAWLRRRQLPTGIARKTSIITALAVGGSWAWVMRRVSRAWLMPSYSTGRGARACDSP